MRCRWFDSVSLPGYRVPRRAPRSASELDLELLRLIDEQYTRRPFFGSRKMVPFLKVQGHWVNRKRVQRLMRILGLAGMAPGPNT